MPPQFNVPPPQMGGYPGPAPQGANFGGQQQQPPPQSGYGGGSASGGNF